MSEIQRLDDTVKGTTMGDPDGPFRYIESLDAEVPTYIAERKDLMAAKLKCGSFKFLDYHVPFNMRADFKPEQWPPEFYKKHRQTTRVNELGFALCSARSKASGGQLCSSKAVNRTLFCRSHGGALHPADKKLSVRAVAGAPPERVEKLDRVQKFMQGFLPVEELDDDELSGGFVRTSAGLPIKTKSLGVKFEQAISKELHRRLNDYLKSKAPRMLEVMYEIADSDMVEPADRIKAAQWIAERVIGKTPDVLVNVNAEKPYEGILDNIQSGSREDYRQKVASSRPLELVGSSSSMVGSEIIDAEVEEDRENSEEDFEFGSESDFSESDAESEDLQRGFDGSGNDVETVNGEELGTGTEEGTEEEDTFVLDAVEGKVEKQKDLKNARERIKKAKARRFAARAVGSLSSSDIPCLIEWSVIDKISNPDFGKFKMGIVLPEQINENVLERVRRSNDPDTQAAKLVAAAAKLAGRGVA